MELPNDINDLKLLVSVLLKRIDYLKIEIVTLRSENVKLREEISTLQSRLNLNSKNSHEPPSSDGLSKKPGPPKAAAKKTGGQKGHTGTTLRMVEQLDQVIVHHAIPYPCCNKKFSRAEPVTSIVQKRRVFDIPKPRTEVADHQLGMIKCCCQSLYGTFPEKVSQSVQYGSRIKALSVLLNTDYKLPLQKIEQLIRDLWEFYLNEITVVNTNAAMYDSLQVVGQDIRENILVTKLAHFSEPGMRVSKQLKWFHTVSTAMSTDLFIHNKRGKDELRLAIKQAERDIRHPKTKQKVATNFQTFEGAQHYTRIQSFYSTLRKYSTNVFQIFIKIL
jgi:transposase